MKKVAKRIELLAESQTLAMAKLARELKSKGHDVISLSIGEPDFDTPDHIRKSAKEAIDAGFTHYTPVSGTIELQEAISAKLKTENNLDFAADQIVVSNGAKQSITNIVLSLIDPGDEVIIPAPYWVSYPEIVKFGEGKSVFINASIENDFKITPEQLEAVITEKTRLLLYSSPCNPSGSVYTKDELGKLTNVLEKNDHIYIVSDEIYEHINYGNKHVSIAQIDKIKDRVIVVNGVSKGFAMTGWRIGYLAAPKWIADSCEKVQGQMTSGPSSISQKAAVTALTSDLSASISMKKEFLTRRDVIIDLLNDLPGITLNVPKGAFYVFPDVSSYFGKSNGEIIINSSTDLCMYLFRGSIRISG